MARQMLPVAVQLSAAVEDRLPRLSRARVPGPLQIHEPLRGRMVLHVVPGLPSYVAIPELLDTRAVFVRLPFVSLPKQPRLED